MSGVQRLKRVLKDDLDSPADLQRALARQARDLCTVEQAVTAYRQLPDGELGIMPGHGHYIPPSAIQATLEFVARRSASQS